VTRRSPKADDDHKQKTLVAEETPPSKDSQVKTLPMPPEEPREQVRAALSVCGAILCLLLTTAIIVYLFYYANAEEQAAKESQHKAEFMRDKAETLIAAFTEHLRQQQGKPVDVKFAEGISTDVRKYYGDLNVNDPMVLGSSNQGKLLSDVAFLCKTQGLFGDAYLKYEDSFQIFAKLASVPQQNEDAWIAGSNCLSGQGDVRLRQGRFAEAEQKYKASLERRNQLRGDRSNGDRETDYAQGLINMGDVNREQGHLDEALRYVEQGLKVETDAIDRARTNSQGKIDAEQAIDAYTRRQMVFTRTHADLLRKFGRLTDARTEIDGILGKLKDRERLSNKSADPDAAITLLVKADILRALGYLEDAATSYNTAFGIWETIVRNDEYNLLTQSSLVDSLLGQGDLFLAQSAPGTSVGSNVEKAAEKYREALTRLSEFHADGDCFAHQAKIALAQMKLGEVALAQGEISTELSDQAKAREHFTDGLMHFLESEGTYESWSRQGDNVFDARSALAAVLCKEGDAYMKLNKLDEAKTAYDRSRQIQEWILKLVPENLERRLDLAVITGNLGEAWLKISERDSEYKPLDQALDLCTQCNQIYIDAHKLLSDNVLFVEQEARSFFLKGLVEEHAHSRDGKVAFETARNLLNPLKEAKRLDRIGEEIFADTDAQHPKTQALNN
jgi:tetratricopeptide (TPR) repeat protein